MRPTEATETGARVWAADNTSRRIRSAAISADAARAEHFRYGSFEHSNTHG